MAEAARSDSEGDPPKLILVRHGQASLGSDDYDRLSERGHRQAERVADRLSAAITERSPLWSGTLLRHRQTLAPLAGSDEANVLLTEDLNEFSTYGLVRAAVRQAERLGLDLPPRHQLADPVMHLDVLLAWFPRVMAAWQDETLEGTEIGSWSAFRERVLRARGQWEACLRSGQSVIVVTSAGVISTVVAALSGCDLARQRELAVNLYNASVSELSLVEGAWQIETCNCTRHLEADGLRTLA
ncbi:MULTISPECIES: histidine phosphatase family protein [unclassified Wenzhouxiangella]|uniref:histidine phosphatase family protein n=1 Tax=unclassified Wenzhouxiangella TaxID=2613841 RepID=UPI0015F266E7|nr:MULTISPECIES: histidine phosphatase family protein [unclassified Wenzhouxiangella]